MKTFYKPVTQLRIILASIVGTSAMTFYSYLISWATDKNFKEPKLLGQMTNRVFLRRKVYSGSPAVGWGIHYLVGCLFAETYAPFWTDDDKNKNLETGLVLGGLSGIAAILIWKFTLNSHPDPPLVHFIRFAGQLFIAHIVFGLVSSFAYNLFVHRRAA